MAGTPIFGVWPPPFNIGGVVAIGAPVVGGVDNRVLFVDPNGDVGQDPALSYFEATRTLTHRMPDNNGGSGYILENFIPPTSPLVLSIKVFEATITGQQDPVCYFGWNVDGADAARGRVMFEIEGNAFDAGARAQEFHVSHTDVGAAHYVRVFSSYMVDDGVNAGLTAVTLTSDSMIVQDRDATVRTHWQDKVVQAHHYEDHFSDIYRLYDVLDNHLMVSLTGSEVLGAGTYEGRFSLSNLYFEDQTGTETLTIWGPDTGTGRTMLLRTKAPPAGGQTDCGLRMGNGTQFGVFFGSGAPSLAANKGSLYIRTDGTGVNDRMYVATNGTGTWTAVVTVA